MTTATFPDNQNYSALRINDSQQSVVTRAFADSSDQNTLTGRGTDIARLDFDNDRDRSWAQICLGTVTHFSPYDGTYRVQLDGKTTFVVCIDSFGRGLPISVGRAAAYPPNSRVVVYYRGVHDPNIIIGSLPDIAAGSRFFSDQNIYTNINHLQSRIGSRKDLYQNTVVMSFNERYFGDGRPPDITSLGDLTYSNFMGGLIHMSMWQLILKMSNGCGLWMNFLDELMRQVSKNYQLWTPSGHLNKYTSCGETMNYGGQALYDWEGLGMLEKPESRDGEEWFDIKKERGTDMTSLEGTAEPLSQQLSPYFRFEQFGGWFGHGGVQSVRALPKKDNRPDNGLYEMGEEAMELTMGQLFRQSVNVNGTYTLQAAGGFALERMIDFPCYQNKFEPYEDEGDSGDNDYQYLGDSGDKVYTLEAEAGDNTVSKSVVRSTGVDDYYTKEKYKTLYAFIKHLKDYVRVDDQEEHEPEGLNDYLSDLKNNQFFSDLEETTENAEIYEDTEKEVSYIKRKSGIYATQDGGFLIRDAYGNEIKTGVNGIEFNSISDITNLAHRRVISMSGDDTIITANKSMDLATVQNDLRLQAYKNLELIGGVSTKGRTVIENRGSETFNAFVEDGTVGEDVEVDGIYLISKDSTVITYTKTIYTKCEEDAYYDYDQCWNYANTTYEIKSGECSEMLVGEKDSQHSDAGVIVERNPAAVITIAHTHVKDNCTVHQTLAVDQGINYKGQIQGSGGVCVSGGGCFGQGVSPMPCTAGEMCGQAAEKDIEAKKMTVEQVRNENADKLYEDAQERYEPEEVGDSVTIENAFFNCRDIEQYGTKEYVFMMPAYINEIDDDKVDEFELDQYYEDIQKTGGNNSSDKQQGPFPGRERWEEECCIIPQSPYRGLINENGAEPFDLEGENNVEKYEKPEAKKPSDCFSAIVIS